MEKIRLVRSGGARSFVRWKMWASIVGSLQKAAAVVYVFAWASLFVGGWVKGVVARALPTSTLSRGENVGVGSNMGWMKSGAIRWAGHPSPLDCSLTCPRGRVGSR